MLYTISTAFAIYFVFWWIVLFLTLPFGIRSQHEDDGGAGQVIPGTDPGAPVAPRMGRKLIWTTLVSAVLFGISMLAYGAGYLNVERLSKLLGMPI
jgi:predicted secreted protein